MLFFSYFKDLVGREVTVELKNDLAIRGTLHSVDQYLNIKLENTRVVDQDKYPHMDATDGGFMFRILAVVLGCPDFNLKQKMLILQLCCNRWVKRGMGREKRGDIPDQGKTLGPNLSCNVLTAAHDRSGAGNSSLALTTKGYNVLPQAVGILSVRNCFIRGSVVRYVQLPPEGVDIELLHDATRREARGG
ncbi:hypothetical protein HHK36_012571 [Tetracentron sinense]|uniref:Sm domain-containing protein n=1 Tax=Tetracentron sinense TaxID=13715 RepID=A0A834Z902_TETSI|nr:hypothetical protein HHK36_012571 [Tetracentron sinense]